MPNPWFRLYAEIRRDPKVRTMPESYQLRLIWLYTLRCEGATERLSREELIYGLDCDETLLETLHGAFHAKGFIDSDWSIPNWNKRQYVSDSSTDRVRKFRMNQGLKQDETLLKRPETQNETDQNRTEQNKTEQKPSRKRATDPTKTELAKKRHTEFKAIIQEYWDSKNKGVQMPWDGREGKHLEMFLRAAPDITADQFRKFLRNRYKSEVNHGERASQWIDWVASYAAGPIDRFGKTIHNGNGVHGPGGDNQRELTEAESYAMWQGMSEQFKRENPWRYDGNE